MPSSQKTVLVTGATGQQGGAAARHLLAGGWHVRALVRDAHSAAATALNALGAELVVGDMADRATMDAAAEGAHGVFSVQRATDTPQDRSEITLGVNVADAARTVGAHLVYTSVAGAERDSGISHWETKWEIEKHIGTLGLPTTILRPVQFMENYASPRYGIGSGVLSGFFGPDHPSPLVAADDIGAFAALAFDDPDRFVGQAIELGSDTPTPRQVATAIRRATGRDIAFHQITLADIDQLVASGGYDADNFRAAHDFAAVKGGWRVDLPALRAMYPGLTTFDTWLERGGADRLRALFAAQPA
ncbi:NmrA/HSCARG family protein [Solihabitans fulvus]|uniref:NmrA/HSCARG family protein n=1 Tax=Solihabitans fulvus TaxID=1892852 RepID=A0A5B2XUH7_9PSEU|nr:NmrA/HSCARG family protein [Solihabitans fulvus]KAA2266973.1 NmrA/HSCARG family protein [Solihabitans fulvus]